MFRFAILVLNGVHEFLTREQLFTALLSRPIRDMVDSIETFEFREASPDVTVEDFTLWHTDLINYRDRLTRNDSGFITSDGELFTHEFDACKCEKFLWEQEEKFMADSLDYVPSEEHYSELERQDTEREYFYNAMDYLD